MDFDLRASSLPRWDHIRLENVIVSMVIGILPQEKLDPQPVRLDLSLYGDFSQAALTGDLNDTVDYAKAYKELKEWMEPRSDELLETLATQTSAFLFNQFSSVQALRLKISKPQALPEGALASYEIYRTREGIL